MRDKTGKQILREVGKQIKAMVKGLLEWLMQEERAFYRYFTRDLLTFAVPVEDLKVPRAREGGNFIPRFSPIDSVFP